MMSIPFSFTAIVFSLFLAVHPFYVSVCEIEVKEEHKTVQVMQRIFADDLEQSLNKKYNLQLDVLVMKDLSAIDSLLGVYFAQHLWIEADGKRIKLRFLGAEAEQDVIWCYLEGQFDRLPAQWLIHNGVLMDEIESQSNIVHLTVGGKIKSLRLSSGKRQGIIKF
jgi:hypothetical protein